MIKVYKNQINITKSIADDWRHLTELCLDSNETVHVVVSKMYA